jgi:hypothetical protein
MKYLVVILMCFAVVACTTKESNLIIIGKVDGLKKGKLYLQKIEDTLLVNIDSVIVDGDANFEFEALVKSPQIHYLYLDKLDNSEFDDRIRFFAEEGEMTINTTLKNFEDATVMGSENQVKLEYFNAMIKRFNKENLALVKEDFEAQKANDQDKLLELEKRFDRNLKRRYLYTVNYALNQKDFEVAPYLMVSEVFDANIKYLDTVYNNLAPNVKKSFYGEELKSLIKERKALEN